MPVELLYPDAPDRRRGRRHIGRVVPPGLADMFRVGSTAAALHGSVSAAADGRFGQGVRRDGACRAWRRRHSRRGLAGIRRDRLGHAADGAGAGDNIWLESAGGSPDPGLAFDPAESTAAADPTISGSIQATRAARAILARPQGRSGFWGTARSRRNRRPGRPSGSNRPAQAAGAGPGTVERRDLGHGARRRCSMAEPAQPLDGSERDRGAAARRRRSLIARPRP